MESTNIELDSIINNGFLVNVFNCIEDGVSILDTDLNIIFTNRKMEEWYSDGRPLVGRKCYEAFHGRSTPCEECPSLQAMSAGRMHHMIKSAAALTPSKHDDMWIDLYAFPLLENGVVTGVIEHVRDITPRVKAENELKKTKEEFRNLVEEINEWVWKMDADSVLTYCSPKSEEMLGYRPDEIVGKKAFGLMDPDVADTVAEAFKAGVEKNGRIENLEYNITRKDGVTVVIETSALPIYEGGKLVGYRGTNRDITDRKRADEALQIAKERSDLYLDLMCHDISNFNQIGMGFLELAMSSVTLDDNEKELFDKVMTSMRGSNRLIDSVRKLNKEEALVPVNVGKITKKIVDRYVFPDRVKATVDVENCWCMADGLYVDIVTNLLNNSVKHSAGPININVKVKCIDGLTCAMTVEDTGPGIPDYRKSHIFERNKLETTRGLGLYLVKSLVKKFGGTINVEDRVPGNYKAGTKFVITLPYFTGVERPEKAF